MRTKAVVAATLKDTRFQLGARSVRAARIRIPLSRMSVGEAALHPPRIRNHLFKPYPLAREAIESSFSL
jgi:hypothetical protein